MKKKIIAICLCVALVAVGIVGATLAYFTDTDKVENTFEVGNVDIDLYEQTDNKVPGMDKNHKYQNNLDYSDIMPGDVLSKKPFIENTGNYEAYVRVLVQINNAAARNAAIDEAYEKQGQEAVQKIYDDIFEGWGINNTKVYDGIEGYTNYIRNSMAQRAEDPAAGVTLYNIDSVRCPYAGAGYQWEDWNLFKTETEKADGSLNIEMPGGYYAGALNEDSNMYVFYLKLAPGASYQLFDGLYVPTDFTNEQMAMFNGLKINIYADAIQTANFTDTTDEATGDTTPAYVNAFNALEAAHPIADWRK